MKMKWMLALMVMLTASTSAFADNAVDGVIFPELKKSNVEGGVFIEPSHIRWVRNGLNKNQVTLQLGVPHFASGINSKVWNYAFNFGTGNGREYVTCQYQVKFDNANLVNGAYWRDKQCEVYIKEKPPVVVMTQTHPLVLNTDGLFVFRGSAFNDLLPEGRDKLTNLAGQLKVGYTKIHTINVTGHSDRIGTAQYNMKLSLARANTVKAYLMEQGVSEGLIHTIGLGATKPVVSCKGKGDALINCLLPNRRIEVVVNGDI